MPAHAHQVTLALGALAGLPWFDRPIGQRARAVWNGARVINGDDAPKTPAARTGANRVIETEERWRWFAVFQIALGAVIEAGETLRMQNRKRRLADPGYRELSFAKMVGLFAGFDGSRAIGVA